MRRSSRLWATAAALVVVLGASRARASGVTEFPDNGSEQEGRGGAWVARASDPLAVAFNPAGLAGQPSRVTIQNNLIFSHTCFSRIKAASDTTVDPLADAQGRYPRICNDIAPSFDPQIGATIRVSDRVGIGALVIGPSTAGQKEFPEFADDASGTPQAPPNRYLLIKESGLILFPTVGIGVEPVDNLRLGASFSWGFAKLKLATAAQALNADSATSQNDIRANLQVADYFIPGFSLGTIWSPTPEIDLAGWYKWSDALRARGDLGTAANYYDKKNAQGNDANVRYGDTIFDDCGTGLPNDVAKKPCGDGGNATFKIAIPMEAKLGIRYHRPRVRYRASEGSPNPNLTKVDTTHERDPIRDDVFDLETDLTWANDSAIDAVEIRFPGDSTGKGLLPVAGVPGGEIPPNGDQPRDYKDVFGVRIGGDYNVVPDKLALRAGGFFESSAADPQYQSLDFAPTTRFGFAFGGTYRIHLGQGEKAGALEVMLGYGHVFFADQTRDDPSADGQHALAGTSCNKADPVSPGQCSDGSQRYRTKWPVNLGTITNAVNVINAGLAYKF